jgi:hypothetical protein
VGLMKVGNVVIFGGAFRWADMREEGKTIVHIHIGGDLDETVTLTGAEDRAFREIFKGDDSGVERMGMGPESAMGS